MAYFSIIVQVYNRPDEIKELLDSLCRQTRKDFNIIIMEDGSREGYKCDEIVKGYSDRLDIKYYYKPNTGQSDSRNIGMTKADADYFIFFDSDVIVPDNYFEIVHKELEKE